MRGSVLPLGLLVLASSANAQQDEPRFCPNQPSLESSACTTEPGRVQLEVSGVDWTLDRQPDAREDTLLFGDFRARFGVGPSTEVQVGWTPYGRVRTRDRTGGRVEKEGGVGDVRLGLRQSLRNPDGKGLSYGVEPFVVLPTGGSAIGDGTWSAGVILPVTYDVKDGVTVGVTGELDALADEDRRGRHFGANLVSGVAVDLTDTLSVTAEAEWLKENDPAGHEHRWLAATGIQYRYARTRALFAEAIAGLNRSAPDVQLYAGIAALF